MSLQSRMCAPFEVVVLGTKRKVSNASNVDSKKPSFPPLEKVGLILSMNLRNPIGYASLIIKLIPSRMICWISIFEGSTNSQSAKSSSVTS